MNIVAYFTSGGMPAIGLTPTVSIWDLAGTIYATASAMTEVAGGFYNYDFTTYDYNKDYVMTAYASTLPAAEQYVVATNESDSQKTQGITKEILGLSQGNFIMSGQTYDPDGRLLTSDMYTYDNATDAINDNNRLHTYNIVSTYDGNGNLTLYRVTEV